MCGLYLCPRTPYLCTAAALNNLLCPEHTQFSLTFRFCTSCVSRKESSILLRGFWLVLSLKRQRSC